MSDDSNGYDGEGDEAAGEESTDGGAVLSIPALQPGHGNWWVVTTDKVDHIDAGPTFRDRNGIDVCESTFPKITVPAGVYGPFSSRHNAEIVAVATINAGAPYRGSFRRGGQTTNYMKRVPHTSVRILAEEEAK